jgi:polar amino acid transport system substrate-binding protein
MKVGNKHGVMIMVGMTLLSTLFLAQPAKALTIYTEDWPPVSYLGHKQLEGMGVEMVQALQAKMGTQDAISLVPWVRGYKALLEEPNIMLFSVGRSAEREQLMYLLGPIAISHTVLYARKGQAQRLLALGDALYKQPVGAYRGSIFADTAKRKGFTSFDLAATPQITATKLMGKRFELWVEGSIVVPAVLQQIGHHIDDIEPIMVLDSLELYLAFSRKTPLSTIRNWENALVWLKKEGAFQKIHKKWLGDEPAPIQVQLLKPNE